MPEYIIAYDIGTSSLKTALVDSSGKVVAAVTQKYSASFGTFGEATQNSEDWIFSAITNTKSLAESHPDILNKICAVGVSGHMLGLLPVDDSGTPLTAHMLHSDTRSRIQEEKIANYIGRDVIYNTTGNVLDARSSLSKLLWLKENEPCVYKDTCKVLQSKDYLAYCFTGCYSTDYSDGVHAQFADITKKVYADDIMKTLGLNPDKLPELHSSLETYGYVTREASERFGIRSGIPVFAGGDGICASLGAGVYENNDTYLCFGTTSWVSSMSDKPYFDKEHRLFSLLNADGNTYGIYGTAQCAGRSIEWIMSMFNCDSYSEFNSLCRENCKTHIKKAPYFLPYIEGVRSPWYDSAARGVFFGMSACHDKSDMFCAVAEGIAFSLKDIIEIFREFKCLNKIKLIGGGGRSDFMVRLISDVTNSCILLSNVNPENSTTIGAAIIAFAGTGFYSDLSEGTRKIKYDISVEPDLKAVSVYDRKFEIYKSLYPALKETFKKYALAEDL